MFCAYVSNLLYGGYNVYKVTSTQRQVSRQETTTWVVATYFDTLFGIGAHCCSTGYICTDCQIGKYNDVEGELECRFCDNAYYQDQTGTTACKACPKGTQGTGMGKTSISNCATCAGGYYNDVEFTIDDREDRTPILLDRAFMKRLNVLVNPQRKYVITTKYSLD